MKNKAKSLLVLLSFLPILSFAQRNKIASDSISMTKKGYARYYTPIGSKEFFNKKQISKEQLLVQVGINCHSMTENSFDPCKVKEYFIMLISNGSVFYQGLQSGALFSRELKTEFKKLSVGDLITIYNIEISNSIGIQKVPSFAYDVL